MATSTQFLNAHGVATSGAPTSADASPVSASDELLRRNGVIPLDTQSPAPTMNKAERLLRNSAAEIAQSPGMIPGVVGIAEGVGRFITDIVKQSPGEVATGMLGSIVGTPLAEAATGKSSSPSVKPGTFSRAFLSDAGRAKLDVIDSSTASPEEQLAALNSIDPTGDLNWGLRGAVEWYDTGSRVAGIERVAGEVPLDEELFGIISTAFIGLPRSFVMKAVTKMAQLAGKSAATAYALRLAKSTPARMIGRVAELSTPFTIPLTGLNILANAGVQVIVNDVIRNALGETSLIGYAEQAIAGRPITGDESQSMLATRASITREMASGGAVSPSIADMEPTPTQNASLVGLESMGAAAILGIALRGRFRPNRPQVGTGRSFLDTGPVPIDENLSNVDAFGKQLESVLHPGEALVTNLADSVNAQRQVVRKALGDDAADMYDALAASQSRAGGEQAVHAARTQGIFPDSNIRTIPVAKLDAMLRAADNIDSNLPPEVLAELTATGVPGLTTMRSLMEFYTHARNARRERIIARENIVTELDNLTSKSARATSPDEVSRLAREIADMRTLKNRKGDIRPSRQQWTDDDIERIIRAGDAVPDVKRFHAGMQDQASKTLDFLVERGRLTVRKASEWRKLWGDDYLPLQEDVLAARLFDKNVAGRLWVRLKDKFYPVEDIESRLGTSLDRERRLDPESLRKRVVGDPANAAEEVVNNPLNAIDAMDRYISRAIRDTLVNDLKRNFVDIMRASPKMSKGIKFVGSATPEQVIAGKLPFDLGTIKGLKRGRKHLTIMRNGNVEFYSFANDILRRSLDFAPFFAEGIMAALRRLYQAGTTGPAAPWFATTAVLWDASFGLVSKRAGRSMGVFDAMLQELTGGRGIPDPTAILMIMYGASAGVSRSMQREAGQWIGNELAESSTWFGRVARMTAEEISTQLGKEGMDGRTLLAGVGEGMFNSYQRSVAGIMHNEVRFGPGGKWMHGQTDTLVPNWRGNNNIVLRMYGAFFEGVHNSVKLGFMAQNMAIAKMRGKPMNKKQRMLLGHEVRSLSGDMSKSGLSKRYNQVVQVLPFANVTVQSMSYLFSAARRRRGALATGVIVGVAIPTASSLMLINEAGEETQDWWYNRTPGFVRGQSIAVPFGRLGAIAEIWNKVYKHRDEDWMIIRLPPELLPFKASFEYGLNAMFQLDHARVNKGSAASDAYEALKSVLPMLTPPAAGAIAAFSGFRLNVEELLLGESAISSKMGLRTNPDPDAYVVNSDMARNVVDGFAALAGTVIQVGAAVVARGEFALEDDDTSFAEAADAMFDEGTFEVGRRAQVANSTLFGIATQYVSTPVTEKYFDTMRTLGTVFRQFRVITDRMVGNTGGRVGNNPNQVQLHKITQDVDGFTAGEIKNMVIVTMEMLEQNPSADAITERMSDILLRKELVKANYGMTARERHDELKVLEVQRQEQARILVDVVILPWERHMQVSFGDDFTPEKLVELVRRSTGP